MALTSIQTTIGVKIKIKDFKGQGEKAFNSDNCWKMPGESLEWWKLCNNKRKVTMKTKGGMKVKDVVDKVCTIMTKLHKTNSNVIIVYKGTCDIKTKTPEELKDEIITTL